MNSKVIVPIAAGLLLVLVLFIAGSPFYIVEEREQVVVTRFNRPVRVIVGGSGRDIAELRSEMAASVRREDAVDVDPDAIGVAQGAGLYMKTPFVDVIERFPDTLLEYDANPENVVTRDKKTLVVDNFAQWRIQNPLLFRIRVRTEQAARGALDDVIYSVMREELGKNDLIEVIRTTKVFSDIQPETDEDILEDQLLSNAILETLTRGREEIMNAVARRADEIARERYGIEVVDVRIKRAELLPANLQAVFSRMQAERERISKGYRSEGRKEASIIEGETDRQKQIILAEAKAQAATLQGEGDAEALSIYAEAFRSNSDLYEFLRSLEVMKQATPAGSELIIGIDSSIFKLLRNVNTVP